MAVQGRGIKIEHCPIRQSSLKLLSRQCTFSLIKSQTQVTANELIISFSNSIFLPIVKLSSLTINLPSSTELDSRQDSSTIKLQLPISEFHLKKGSVYLGESLAAEFSIDLFNLSNNNNYGSAKIKLSPIDLQNNNIIKSYLEKLSSPLKLYKGTLDLNANLSIKNFEIDKDSIINFKADNISGTYDQLQFKNLNINSFSLSGFPKWKNKQSAKIKIDSIRHNTSVQLDKIQFKLRINKTNNQTSNISMKEVVANFLGGKLRSEQINIKNLMPQSFILKVDALELSELLKLSGKSITGTGKISGKLPINFSSQKPSIEDGRLQALAPGGKLEYTPSVGALETAKQSKDASFILKALEQFDYDQMEIKLRYHSEGLLQTDLFLHGQNKNVFSDRKIEFNINFEENIISLLKSIRLTSQVNKENWVK